MDVCPRKAGSICKQCLHGQSSDWHQDSLPATSQMAIGIIVFHIRVLETSHGSHHSRETGALENKCKAMKGRILVTVKEAYKSCVVSLERISSSSETNSL